MHRLGETQVARAILLRACCRRPAEEFAKALGLASVFYPPRSSDPLSLQPLQCTMLSLLVQATTTAIPTTSFAGLQVESHLCCANCFTKFLPRVADSSRQRSVFAEIWPDDAEETHELLKCQLRTGCEGLVCKALLLTASESMGCAGSSSS